MYDWKFDEKTGGIFTGRHDMFGEKYMKVIGLKPLLELVLLDIILNIGDSRSPKRMNL